MTESVAIAPITSQQDAAIANIIRSVGAEFGAIGEGFGPGDEEVGEMSQYYRLENGSCYFVAQQGSVILGGGGVANFDTTANVCELRKLFLLPQYRGKGVGLSLLNACLDFACEWGYHACYLDTLSTMVDAIVLYERAGFRRLPEPFVASEHNGCDVWMILDFQRGKR